jgi:hypothetical protein
MAALFSHTTAQLSWEPRQCVRARKNAADMKVQQVMSNSSHIYNAFHRKSARFRWASVSCRAQSTNCSRKGEAGSISSYAARNISHKTEQQSCAACRVAGPHVSPLRRCAHTCSRFEIMNKSQDTNLSKGGSTNNAQADRAARQ